MKIVKVHMRERLSRGRYLVPNFVTVGNMFCGFLCVVYAASGRFENAAIAICIAILLDGLDGRVARGLNATSKFGLEFDSLSDLVSFGLAPAFLMYRWCFLPEADEFGVIVSFIFCLCAASRLARFNITTSSLTRFEGMPTPGAAAVIAAFVNYWPNVQSSSLVIGIGTFFMLLLSFLMVSTLEFFSVKRLRIGSISKPLVILIGTIIALTWYDSGKGFLLLTLSYMLSGPVTYFLRKIKSKDLSFQSDKVA